MVKTLPYYDNLTGKRMLIERVEVDQTGINKIQSFLQSCNDYSDESVVSNKSEFELHAFDIDLENNSFIFNFFRKVFCL